MSKDAIKTAVALQYNQGEVPKLTAKASGAFAERIVQLAEQHGVYLHQDPILASVLAQLDYNDEVPEELFKIVAEVIAFAYLVAGKVPEGWVDNLRELKQISDGQKES